VDEDDLDRRRFLHTEWITLALAAPAMLGVTLLFGSWRDAVGVLLHAPLQIAGGYAAMALAVLLAASALGPRSATAPWLLGPWNMLLFALGATVACGINCLVLGMDDVASYFTKPLLLLLTFGLIPALLMGQVAVLVLMLLQRRT
jgi:hypothetical protein